MLILTRNLIAVIPISQSPRQGLIIVPEPARWQMPTSGIVKYTAPSVVEIRRGDRVIFPAYSGTKVVIEGEGELILLTEDSIEAIFVNQGEKFWTESQILAATEQAQDRQEFFQILHNLHVTKQESKSRYAGKRIVPTQPSIIPITSKR